MDSGFWILGGSGGCTTRQFSDGALRSEARIPPGPSLGGGAEPTVSDTVGEREGTWWWKQREKQVKLGYIPTPLTVNKMVCFYFYHPGGAPRFS